MADESEPLEVSLGIPEYSEILDLTKKRLKEALANVEVNNFLYHYIKAKIKGMEQKALDPANTEGKT